MEDIIQGIHKDFTKKIAEIRVGYAVRVHQKIKEGDKERVQIFEGVVIKIGSGHGLDKNFTVRKVVEGIGIEKIFPFFSANIVQIEIKKKSPVKHGKLYYTRTRFGKQAKMKGDLVDIKTMDSAKKEENKEEKEPVSAK